MTQRRDFVRVPVALAVDLGTHVDDAVDAAGEGCEWVQFSTRTVNLSGGGFAIQHSRPLPHGGIFDVKLMIPTRDEPLGLIARAVRVERRDTPAAGSEYDIGFCFLDPPESLRRHILSFLIRLQQESLQHG